MQVSIRTIGLTLGVLTLLVAVLLSVLNSPAEAQDEGGCANASEVQTYTGTNPQTTEPFSITGTRFRIVFDTEPVNGSDPSSLTGYVTDESGQRTGELFTANDGSDGSEIISTGPGTFRLEIEAENVDYNIAVDDCGDTDDDRGQGGAGGGATDRQYGNDDSQRNGDGQGNADRQYGKPVIIKKTIVKGLPKTGGPSLLLLPLAAALVVAGIAVVRRS